MSGAYYNEIDPYAAQWLRNLIAAGHIAPGDVDERSIVEVQAGDLRGYTQCHFFAGIGVWSHALRSAGWPDDRSVWTGSCPCQPFSAAGKGEGVDDARHLWPEWFRLIREHRPVAIFGEQVSAAIRHDWLDLVSADLEGLDYAVGAAVLGAHSVGAPHIRQRLYFVAHAERQKLRAGGSGGTEQAPSGMQGTDGQRERLRDDVGQRSSSCELADPAISTGQRREPQPDQRAVARCNGEVRARAVGHPSGRGCGERRDAPQPRRSGHADGSEQHGVALGDTNDAGPQGRRLPGADPSRHGGGELAARAPSAADELGDPAHFGHERPWGARSGRHGFENASFWRDCDWLPCIDGKARPVEPGTFPLAHGATARVGRLRAYGNAINAAQAEEFIRAYREVVNG